LKIISKASNSIYNIINVLLVTSSTNRYLLASVIVYDFIPLIGSLIESTLVSSQTA
jgi:hypothetical protein